MLKTPILFLVFNRPDTTKRVFAKIREIQPEQLFIAADGAREGKEGEREKVAQVRKLILDNIDWNCEVKTLFREKNLGCGKAVSEGITWFFENVEQGIILEDDTLPDLSFFPFCEELLERYKNEEKVMMITAYCSFGKMKAKDSYSFIDGVAGIWGWATWKRVWNLYDYDMKDYPDYCKETLYKNDLKQELKENFDKAFNKQIDTWDYQLVYSIEKQSGLSICPNKNIVTNLGFSPDATHTTNWERQVYMPPKFRIKFPLVHPKKVCVSLDYVSTVKKFNERIIKGKYSKIRMIQLRFKRKLQSLIKTL